MKLLSYERTLLAHYILQSDERRATIYEVARTNPNTSGPLLQAYRAIEEII